MAGFKGKKPRLNEGEKYHVFLSYCEDDWEDVNHVKTTLESQGFSVSEPCPVKSKLSNIETGVRKSNKVLLFVTENYLKSTWAHLEIGISGVKEGDTKRLTMIPIVKNLEDKDIPALIRSKHMLRYDSEVSEVKWKRLFDLICSDELSTRVAAGDIANGLAWSYFYGYLNLVLPGIKERVAASDIKKNPKYKHIQFLDKMVIILPNSGYCPENLHDDDENLHFVDHIEFNASRAGNINRDYKSSVYLVEHPSSGKSALVIAEFATPLMSMHEMELGGLADLSSEERLTQKLKFEDKLIDILERQKDCFDKYCFLPFDDTRDENLKPVGWKLSEIMAEKAFVELKKLDWLKTFKDEKNNKLSEDVLLN